MNNKEIKKYEIVIVGGGVTGTAILYVLSKYTNLTKIALIEKYADFGEVNSNNTSNSQTLHFGDIETNYSLEKALVVKEAAEMLEGYLLKTKNAKGMIYDKSHKLALAVGDVEVQALTKRFEDFKISYPKLRLLNKKEIGKIEPRVVEKRNPQENISALMSEDGYIVDYKALSKSFVENANQEKNKNINIFLNTVVESISKKNDNYQLKTKDGLIESRVVIFAGGAYSLLFAKSLGYGGEYFLLPVAGNFYAAMQRVLNGKVYTMQKEKLPFAAVHGDPDVHNADEVRFGPTAKVIPILERRHWKTFWDFLKTDKVDLKVLRTLLKIISDRDIFGFILQNMLYDIPFIGKKCYINTIEKIIPKISKENIYFKKRLGGIRPQLVNKETGELVMGVGEIVGDNIIFNVTPSPGATACLQTAKNTAKKLSKFFGDSFVFEENKLLDDLKK
ncbi:MAG: FAD-dependent oxidoreductase [Candidatus Moraniibacteriota bacterium]